MIYKTLKIAPKWQAVPVPLVVLSCCSSYKHSDNSQMRCVGVEAANYFIL